MLVSSQVMARCNPELISFGSSVREVSKKFDDKFLFPSEIPEDIPMLPVLIPGEELCRDEKAFEGTAFDFLFIEDQLVEMRMNKLSPRPSLVLWAEKIYGEKKNKPLSFFQDEPNASWVWDNFNAVIAYSIKSDLDSQVVESIIIQSRRHQKLFEKISVIEDSVGKESNNE